MILKVNDLTKVFIKEKEFKAVDSVSFMIEQGEIVGLLDSNGAGKPQLLRCLLVYCFLTEVINTKKPFNYNSQYDVF